MSQVKITGNASGTGVLTIAAPNTNTDRTFSLPDETGTVLTTESSVPLGKIATPVVKLIGDSGQTTSGTVMGSKIVTFNESHSSHVDTHNFFNSSTNRIVPTIAGYYFVTFTMEILSAYRSGPTMTGGNFDFRNDNALFGSLPTTLSNIVYFNGTDSFTQFNSRSNPGNRSIDFAEVSFMLVRAD
tara:strand:- start:191 stop:745 length:555 start_codon:yes stop_codon:yes gene_type:complete